MREQLNIFNSHTRNILVGETMKYYDLRRIVERLCRKLRRIVEKIRKVRRYVIKQ